MSTSISSWLQNKKGTYSNITLATRIGEAYNKVKLDLLNVII